MADFFILSQLGIVLSSSHLDTKLLENFLYNTEKILQFPPLLKVVSTFFFFIYSRHFRNKLESVIKSAIVLPQVYNGS